MQYHVFLESSDEMINFLKEILIRKQNTGEPFFLLLKKSIGREIKGRKNQITFLVINVSFQDVSHTYYSLRSFVSEHGVNNIELDMIVSFRQTREISFQWLISVISKLYNHFSSQAIIKIKGLPYCLFPEADGMFLETDSGDFVKRDDCNLCKFNISCRGIPAIYASSNCLQLLRPYILPEEIAIEIINHCHSPLNRLTVRKIIDEAKKMKVSIIRFVLLGSAIRPDIYELLRYAKENNFQVRLDISRIIIENFASFVKKVSSLIDYVILYVDCNDRLIETKEREIVLLKRIGIKTVRVVTIVSSSNFNTLDKLFSFMLRSGVDKWAVNRDVHDKDFYKVGRIIIDKLFEMKLNTVCKRYNLRIHMTYPLPFCCCNPVKTNFVCTGPKSVDGYERILIDFSGKIKPMHYFDEIIGDFTNIKSSWDHPFLKSLRNYTLLPSVCKTCFLLDKCKGGSRFCAFYARGTYNAADPLMNYYIAGKLNYKGHQNVRI